MKELIVIVGNGGAGKKTTGQLLYSKLCNSSWTHMRWMLALKIWEPTPKFDDLFIRNAASVISNYFNEGVQQAILTGGIFSQDHLDRLLELLPKPLNVRYFWLNISDTVRAQRLIGRARDEGDSPEAVERLVPRYSFHAPSIQVENGSSHVLDTESESPEQVVDRIIAILDADE